MEADKKSPTKFILALRRYREYKKQWMQEMDSKLAVEEERLRAKSSYLYHDMDVS